MKIGIVGAAGRMGRQNIAEVLATSGTEIGGGLEVENSPFIGKDITGILGEKECGIKITDNIEQFVAGVDAIIDFSSPASTIAIGKKAAEKGIVHIIGTTGLSLHHEETLRTYAASAKIVYAPNFSIGVNLLMSLVEKVSATLDESYDIEILEMHHNKKVDAPSGTALGLGKSAAKGRGVKLDSVWCKSRDGNTGARKAGEIGFATLRGGDVVGDHTVMFATEGERVELTHKASSRRVFSKGAVRAAIWAHTQKPGLYDMKDVIGI